MANRTETCPTCNAQTTITMCDNCHNDIPADTTPAVSGRVWDPDGQRYLPVTLCGDCADLPLTVRSVAIASNGS